MNETILVVDDNPEIVEVLKLILSAEGYHLLCAHSGQEALTLFNQQVDLVILDVMMPGMNGIQTCLALREKSNVPILFLTAKDQESDKKLGFSSGADDYLVKPFSYNELTMRVQAMLRRYHVYQGQPLLQEDKMSLDNLEIDFTQRQVFKQGQLLNLTDIEYELLVYFANHRKQIISIMNLFEGVWKENYYYGANNTVMVHIRNLRKKIEDDPQNPKLIQTVWGKGYYCA